MTHVLFLLSSFNQLPTVPKARACNSAKSLFKAVEETIFSNLKSKRKLAKALVIPSCPLYVTYL